MKKKLVIITEHGFSSSFETKYFYVHKEKLLNWLKSELYRHYVENDSGLERREEREIIDDAISCFSARADELNGSIEIDIHYLIEIEICDLIEVE